MSDNCERDLFKEEFKYYKRKSPPPNLEKVIDFDQYTKFDAVRDVRETYLRDNSDKNQCPQCKDLHLNCHQTWELFSIKGLEGFIYIKNPFSVTGQQKWIRKCLEEYPCKPSITNLDEHHTNVGDIWSLRNEPECYLKKLCWATLGYHHNWDTKLYNKEHKSNFPPCLKELTKHFAESLGFQQYNPEAAIVNYYNTKSSLSIHNDHSEESKAPIISFSFGQTGLFLIGTENKCDKPEAVLLRSGDVIVMSGASRLSYHAVPCILSENVDDKYFGHGNDDWLEFYKFINKSRINISVRQVYENKL